MGRSYPYSYFVLVIVVILFLILFILRLSSQPEDNYPADKTPQITAYITPTPSQADSQDYVRSVDYFPATNITY